jgi:hypothetical protein
LLIFPKTPEDILLHQISIANRSRDSLLSSNILNVTVRDKQTGQVVPSRITIVDSRGTLAALYDFGATNLATRPGVCYTAGITARLGLLPGEYMVYATRGPEYSVARAAIKLSGTQENLELDVTREVDTRGWIACDTHIHTYEISRHGDAMLMDRMMTLAGEGIELAASTEHNIHADYLPAAKILGLNRYFTVLPGNEVTTVKGHFNIFPVSLSAAPPNAKLATWPELMTALRATPNAQVVILNHPMDTHAGFTPFAATNFNSVTARNLRGDFPFTFDAMEVINSGAMRSDWMEPFRAWFALLNRGYRVTGVSGSDSHDVSRFIVGQGRTYIQGDDSIAGKIGVDEACRDLKAGRAVVSLGIFPSITIRGSSGAASAGPGNLLSAIKDDGLDIRVTASWSKGMHSERGKAPSIALYANGREAARHDGAYENNLDHAWHIQRPRHDTYYLAIASAPGVTAPYWAVARPYQPTSTRWEPVLLGATNPVWVDADGDKHFTSPREYAEKLAREFQNAPENLIPRLAEYDWATATQCAELLDISGVNLHSLPFQQALKKAAPQTLNGFQDYLATVTRR